MDRISQTLSILAIITSIAAFVLSVVIFLRDKNREHQNEIFKQKLIKYKDVLKIGRILIYGTQVASSDKRSFQNNWLIYLISPMNAFY